MKLGDLIDNLRRLSKAHSLDADVWIKVEGVEAGIGQIDVNDYADEGTTSDIVLVGSEG